MSGPEITVVAIQPTLRSDLTARPSHAVDLLDTAFSEHGVGIYVLPEYYLAQLLLDPTATVALAETVPGPSTRPLLAWTARTKCSVVVGLLERSADRDHPYNTAALLGPDGVLGCYRKTHLWDLGPTREPYRECRLFQPGQALEPFSVHSWRVGVMICADGVFPECPRVLTLRGADLIAYPNSRSSVGLEAEAAARANVVPVVVSNPIGFNGVDQCGGTSRILTPNGAAVAVGDGQEGWVAARLNLDEIREQRRSACQVRLRRPELYGPITEG